VIDPESMFSFSNITLKLTYCNVDLKQFPGAGNEEEEGWKNPSLRVWRENRELRRLLGRELEGKKGNRIVKIRNP